MLLRGDLRTAVRPASLFRIGRRGYYTAHRLAPLQQARGVTGCARGAERASSPRQVAVAARFDRTSFAPRGGRESPGWIVPASAAPPPSGPAAHAPLRGRESRPERR